MRVSGSDLGEDRALKPRQPWASGFPGGPTPQSAIGGRASAVVVMVESKEIVILTTAAGHRLPH
jgi:hypothetical protein